MGVFGSRAAADKYVQAQESEEGELYFVCEERVQS